MEARAAAEQIGTPVVMKIISPDLVHKSDAGAVMTGIASPDEAEVAYTAILCKTRTPQPPPPRILGVIVEQQMPPGLEMFIGGKTDPTFGKIITVGFGGTLIEPINDVAIAVLPVTRSDSVRMIQDLHGYRLIKGYRGPPLG